MGYQRLLLIATAFAIAAFLTLVVRIAHPHHRQLALTIYGVGWIPFLLSVRQFWVTYSGHLDRIWVWRSHLAVAIGMLVLAWAFKVLIPVERSPLLEMDLDQLPATLEADLQQLALIDDKMQSLTTELIDAAPVSKESPAEALSTEQGRQLRDSWSQFIEASFELEVLKARYRAFYQVNGFTHPHPHAQAFLIAYGAFVSQYRAAAVVTTKLGQDGSVKKLLDDSNQRAGIPDGSFTRLQMLVTHPDEILRLNAGRAYLQLMKTRLDKDDPSVARTETHLSEITRMVFTETAGFVNNPLDILENKASHAWYPLQKGVALSMASVRTVTRDYFISRQDLVEPAEKLLPGDIMLTRREWHLTNLGIPGYWTHAALHLGSLEAIDQYFSELSFPDGKSATEIIREQYPTVYQALQGVDEAGEVPSVIEALRPGVIVQSLTRSAAADSLAVLRPKISMADRWQVVLAALPHFGKPYNYQFDFQIDSALLCSQLVHKAYEAVPGLRLEPKMSGGRLLLSPNEIAIKYDNEMENGNSELELVLFLDGTDVGQVASRDADEFRKSWSRPKWHIVFEGD